MTLVVPAEGENQLLLKALKNTSDTESYLLKLYVNDYTPVAASTATDFTQASFSGYAAKTLTRSGWGSVSQVSNKAALSYGTAQTWTNAGATDAVVYGYFVQGATSGAVLWAEKFDTARTLAPGDSLTFTPAATLSSEA